ncbi:hypothetical protein [Desulfosporosinus shakirovi]|nr:hypothetical protein [Desulfosporosinus sp. SRJS8]
MELGQLKDQFYRMQQVFFSTFKNQTQQNSQTQTQQSQDPGNNN